MSWVGGGAVLIFFAKVLYKGVLISSFSSSSFER